MTTAVVSPPEGTVSLAAWLQSLRDLKRRVQSSSTSYLVEQSLFERLKCYSNEFLPKVSADLQRDFSLLQQYVEEQDFTAARKLSPR